MWHSSFLFQLLWNVNIQYLLLGYSWDLINHSDGCFNTILMPADRRTESSSHTGCESFPRFRKNKEVESIFLSLNHYIQVRRDRCQLLECVSLTVSFLQPRICFTRNVVRLKIQRIIRTMPWFMIEIFTTKNTDSFCLWSSTSKTQRQQWQLRVENLCSTFPSGDLHFMYFIRYTCLTGP